MKTEITVPGALREVCEASLQALSDDELRAALRRAEVEAETARLNHEWLSDETRRRQRAKQAACPGHVDSGGFIYGRCTLCGIEL